MMFKDYELRLHVGGSEVHTELLHVIRELPLKKTIFGLKIIKIIMINIETYDKTMSWNPS